MKHRDEKRQPESKNRKALALSHLERQIVALVVQGLKDKEIAEEMSRRPEEIKSHIRNIFTKLGASDRLEMVLLVLGRWSGKPTIWPPR